MKYLDQPGLSRLSQSLSHDGPECSVHTRIEAYSCKNIKRDKKLFKLLESSYKDEAAHSPPLPSWLSVEDVDMTPFGPFDKHASRKTLYLLIATLNIAYPDYDFSDVRPAHFTKEQSGASVLNALSTTLVSPQRAGLSAPRTYSAYPTVNPDLFPQPKPTSSSLQSRTIHSPLAPPPIVSGTHPFIYRILDDVIGLSDCEVFSYTPDVDSDPHASDDDDDDVPSDESSDEDEPLFDFDEAYYESSSSRSHIPTRGMSDSSDDSEEYPPRRHGALLWSSHWFFLNRKQKRIVYISVWARTRRPAWIPMEETLSSERFIGWEGATGAGARAMGIAV
ncbi:Maf1 regulator-domain-containing protein [Mucidula mucida]|nr:Maf1 regulator-domain-containing protein [Mucidula mucida]